MFAKPSSKKAMPQTTKQKPQHKQKTVSVKTGVKAPQVIKKTKIVDGKIVKGKPPPRPESGYSLYSADSEDPVSSAYDEMNNCERMLTHLKLKQKSGNGKTKVKVRKKMRDDSSGSPRALNEDPPLTKILPGISSLYGTPYPYGAAQFLRQLESKDFGANPIFNSRLASSTPDPEKFQCDVSPDRLPNPQVAGLVSQEIPERDISTVSSVPPNVSHLQNMQDMIEIYKQIEINKTAQLQEAAVKEALNKLNNMPVHQAAYGDTGQGQIYNQGQMQSQGQMKSQDQMQCQGQMQFQGHPSVTQHRVQGNRRLSRGTPELGIPERTTTPTNSARDSGGFVTSGTTSTTSLGFTTTQPGESAFRPVPMDGHRDSNIGAFQPYMSNEMPPPQHWLKDMNVNNLPSDQYNPFETNVPKISTHHQSQGQIIQGQMEGHQLNTQQSQPQHTYNNGGQSGHQISPESQQTSDSTEYMPLTRSEVKGQGEIQGSSKVGDTRSDSTVDYRKQNGLFQLHRRKSASSSGNDTSKSDKSDNTSTTKGQSSLDEVPERDLPVMNTKLNSEKGGKSINTQSSSSSDGTFKLPGLQGQKNESQNLSGLTTSTPRNPNLSGIASSCGGKIVFIPNDSTTPNVIGYVPGIPGIPSSIQPIGGLVTNELGIASQGVPAPQDTSGSGYCSSATAQAIAAGDVGIRKLRYLLKELKECNNAKDMEVGRLVGDIEDTVNAIPQLAVTFNLQTEIDLAIQPLRSENSQLRRKVRLIGQQLKDRDLAANQEPRDVNFEILHLQTANDRLQRVVCEEQERKTRLAAEVQYLYQEIHKMKVEKSRFIAQTSEKETEQLKTQQQMTLEVQQIRHDLDLAKKTEESTQNKLESVEKENHILQITLKQRDGEIVRKQEVVETMKESVNELLIELEQSRVEDHIWDQNQSCGLHRLMNIVEENTGTVFLSDKPKQENKIKRHKSPGKNTRHADIRKSKSPAKASRTPDRHTRIPERRSRTPERRSRTPERRLRTPERRSRTPERRSKVAELAERRKFDFDSSGGGTTSTARLTRAALAHHDRRHGPTVGRLGPDGKQGPVSESELDTFVEMRMQDRNLAPGADSRNPARPIRRRTSSSSPVRRKRDVGRYQYYTDSALESVERDAGGCARNWQNHFRQRETTMGQDSDEDVTELSTIRPEFDRDRRGRNTQEHSLAYRKAVLQSRGLYNNTGTEVSVEQSRYSVTDYFRKYHPHDPTQQSSRPKEAFTDSSHRPRIDRLFSDPVSTSSEIDDRFTPQQQTTREPGHSASRLAMFRGHNDPTISAIDDDNISSVSMSSVTTANTNDERHFRRGIASLDANIARLQQALIKTKSMLN